MQSSSFLELINLIINSAGDWKAHQSIQSNQISFNSVSTFEQASQLRRLTQPTKWLMEVKRIEWPL